MCVQGCRPLYESSCKYPLVRLAVESMAGNVKKTIKDADACQLFEPVGGARLSVDLKGVQGDQLFDSAKAAGLYDFKFRLG